MKTFNRSLAIAALAFTAMAPPAFAGMPKTQREFDVWVYGYTQGTLNSSCALYKTGELTDKGLRISALAVIGTSTKKGYRHLADEAFSKWSDRFVEKSPECIRILRPIFFSDTI